MYSINVAPFPSKFPSSLISEVYFSIGVFSFSSTPIST